MVRITLPTLALAQVLRAGAAASGGGRPCARGVGRPSRPQQARGHVVAGARGRRAEGGCPSPVACLPRARAGRGGAGLPPRAAKAARRKPHAPSLPPLGGFRVVNRVVKAQRGAARVLQPEFRRRPPFGCGPGYPPPPPPPPPLVPALEPNRNQTRTKPFAGPSRQSVA